MSEYLVGKSEAEERARAWARQTSTDRAGVSYPSATNNRGFAGRREEHAYGDMVGGDGSNGIHNNVRMMNPDDNQEMHASGDMVGGSLPSQGGCHQNAKSRGGGSNMPSQGGHHMAPMSGDMSAPRSKGSRRESHARGEMVGDEREEHGFGQMVGRNLSRGYNAAKKAATPVVSQGMNYAKQQAGNVKNAGMNYAKQQAEHLGNQARNYGSQQLAKGSAHLAGMSSPNQGGPAMTMKRGGHMEEPEHHSWGSFVRGANKTAKTVGRGISSGAKTVGRGISSGAQTVGHGISSGAKTVGKAVAPMAKQAGNELLKQGKQAAIQGALTSVI